MYRNFEPLLCMIAYNLLCKDDINEVQGLPKPQDSQPYKKCEMYWAQIHTLTFLYSTLYLEVIFA